MRTRTWDWLQLQTDQVFKSYGIVTRQITVSGGEDHLDAFIMKEVIDIMRQL